MTVPLPHHDRVRRQHAVHYSANVDVDDAIVVRDRQLVRLAADTDAGIVEDVVEPAVLFRRVLDQRTHRVRIAHVECRPSRRRAQRRRLGGRDRLAPLPDPARAPVERDAVGDVGEGKEHEEREAAARRRAQAERAGKGDEEQRGNGVEEGEREQRPRTP